MIIKEDEYQKLFTKKEIVALLFKGYSTQLPVTDEIDKMYVEAAQTWFHIGFKEAMDMFHHMVRCKLPNKDMGAILNQIEDEIALTIRDKLDIKEFAEQDHAKQ